LTGTVNLWLKGIVTGTLWSAGRSTLIYGGFKYSTRNSLHHKKVIGMMNTWKIRRNERRESCPVDYAPIRAGSCNENIPKNHMLVKTRICNSSSTTHPLGVNVTEEWYMRAISDEGIPWLLNLRPNGAFGVYKTGVNLKE
jgi:hypothetical protein